jgi:nitrogen-specific signal transduction histidine kinase
MTDSPELRGDVAERLRLLAHDLSNALEIILHATYLLGEAGLDPDCREWTRLIDQTAQDAARINHEIREALRSQTGVGPQTSALGLKTPTLEGKF